MEERTYAEVISSGTYADSLRATRDLIAEQLDAGVLARDLASLTKRLMDIQKELIEIEGDGRAVEETPAEKAAREREERRQGLTE